MKKQKKPLTMKIFTQEATMPDVLHEYLKTWDLVDDIREHFGKTETIFKEQITQLTLQVDRLERHSDEVRAEAAALKVLYLPYIADDVKEGM